MKKHVLLIANEYTTIVNFRMELVSALIREGHTVAVALPLHERVTEISALGCEIYSLPIDRKSKNPLKDFMIIRHICKILKAFSPDMVFTFTIKRVWWYSMRFESCTLCCYNHGIGVFYSEWRGNAENLSLSL